MQIDDVELNLIIETLKMLLPLAEGKTHELLLRAILLLLEARQKDAESH